MEYKKKALLMVLCVAVILVSAVSGTYAYLTDAESAENTFTVGRVGITLTAKELAVKNLVPSASFDLTPTVTVNADSEESYVRMIVKISNYGALKALYGDPVLLERFAPDWNRGDWPCSGITESGDTGIYEFRYKRTVSTADADALPLSPLFTTFTVPQKLNGTQLATLTGLTLTVEAHAIQASGFDNADSAWAAFAQQHPAA